MRKFPALGSALVLALTGAFVTDPALARTRHPSTAQERQQTRELNLQSLQQAQGVPANQQAMNAVQPQEAPTPAQSEAPAANTDQPEAITPAAPNQPAPGAMPQPQPEQPSGN